MGRSPKAVACPERIHGLLFAHCRNRHVRYRNSDVCRLVRYTVAVSTSFVALAARLFLRLLEIVRSMTAPQLIHFQA